MSGSSFLPPIVQTLTADISEFSERIAEAVEKVAGFGERHAEAKIGATITDLQAKIDAAKEELAGLDAEGDRAVVLRADISDYEAKMAEVKASTDEAEHSSSSSFGKLGTVGKAALLGVAGAVVAVGAAGIEMANKYDASTAMMAGKAGITTAAASKIGDAFLATAGKSTFSAAQMMDAFGPVSGEFVTMYGHALSASDALKVMSAAQDAAEASGEPLATTTKALADTMLVYHLGVGQAAMASDVLWNTSRRLGIGISDLGTSLGRLEPRIAGSGMSLQQTGGFMLELAQSAGSGRQAMRIAGTAIQSIISPSTAAQKALGEMGVSLTDSNGKFIGMKAAIAVLHGAFAKIPGDSGAVAAAQSELALQTQLATDKTKKQTPALKAAEAAMTAQIAKLKLQAAQLSKSSAMQAIFGRNANIMAGFVAGGVPAFDAATNAAGRLGTAQSAAQRNAATFEGKMKTLEATGKDLATSFGNLLIPIVTTLASVVLTVTNYFIQHKAVAAALAIVIGTVLTAAIAVYVAGLVTAAAASVASFATMIASAATWVATTVAAVATAVASFVAGAATSAAAWIAEEAPMIAAAVATAAAWVAQTAVMAAASVAGAVAAAAAWVVANAAMIAGIGLVVLAVAAAVLLIIKYHKDIERAVIAAWHAIEAAAEAVWHAIQTAVSTVISFITGLITAEVHGWEAIFNGIVAVVTTVWDNIESAASAVISAITGFFKKLPGDILGFLAGLPGDFLALGEKMAQALLSAFSHIGSDLSGLIKSAVGHIPGVGGLLSHIPALAAGGIVAKPTLAMVGEAGPEAVVPLAQLAKWTSGVAPLPAAPPGTAGGGGGAGHGAPVTINAPVTVTLQGVPQTFVEQIRQAIADNNREIAYTLRAAR